MEQNAAIDGWPDDFSGTVRLFPLPNLVLFPHVVQPLHIFEPRYCDMLTESVATDKLIAMALLKTGWEPQYKSRPEVAKTICVGKIISHTPTEDGRHNILLLGMKRAEIIREHESKKSFRAADVKICDDLYPAEDAGGREHLIQRLRDLFSRIVPEGFAAQESFQQLVGQDLPLGILTDTITYALNLPLSIKQQLLAEFNVDIRSRLLIRCLEQQLKSRESTEPSTMTDEFPPKFSQN
ncbi:MAG: LON peptidase substrate-binding domain-containing protein [Pirellulaceae bacterium]